MSLSSDENAQARVEGKTVGPLAAAAAAGSVALVRGVDYVEVENVESVPKSMKQKVQLLVEKLKADPAIAWKDRGEFLHDGVAVIGVTWWIC